MEIRKFINKAIKICAVLLILLVSKTGFAQNGMWYSQSTNDTNYTYTSVYFYNFLTGWICGTHGKIFKTTDGGYNWTQQLTNSYQNYFQKIRGRLYGTDTARYIYACGYVNNSNPASGVIQETTNGGTIWTNKTMNFFSFKNIFFINGFTGFVVGSRADSVNSGRILKTTNSGTGAANTNYTSYGDASVLRLGTFYGITFINTNTGWVSATNSSNVTTLLKTTNTGVNWNITGTPISGAYINDIKFIDEYTGFACGGGANGGRAKLYKTTDGGMTWTEKTYFEANAFTSMSWVKWFPPGGGAAWRGFVAGENGAVFRTDDLAASWTLQITPTVDNLLGIYFVDESVGWSVGNNGEILATWHGGVSVNNISSTVPDNYKIYQNYPNPFNPTTTIKFDMLKSGFVTIDVFDATGRRLDNLVNENLKPGSYSVTWDAKGLSSGIYYYRISSGDFTKTMKMSLVK